MGTFARHIAAVQSGEVTRSNIIGIRKAVNASERRAGGWPLSYVAPKFTDSDLAALERAIERDKPRVIGELHDSGLKLLRDRRYRKRLASVADIVANLESFHLIAFDRIGSHGLQSVPVYEARGNGRWFWFRNVPWQQSAYGGHDMSGPEILKESGI